MAEINKSKGTTKSEKYLVRIAEHTFLNLWCWPNVYRKPGKELCDLLVVCGDNVLIFSDKNINWPKSQDINIAWPRWYRRAIKESAKQIRGAERWIESNPKSIFLDAECTKPLPVAIPDKNSRKMHGIAVALGAHKACSDFFAGDSGSFMVRPSIQGDEHSDPESVNYFPFAVGNIEPSGSFIHVMNDITLDILMKELDTITDFTDYLEEKSSFIKSGNLGSAAGEEELIAHYVTHIIDDEKHGFVHPDNRAWNPDDRIAFDIGHYESLRQNPQYILKKEADKNSYLWDSLIKAFTDNMLKGTTIVPNGGVFELSEHEIGVRIMSHEPRVMRRLLGEGILDVLEKAHQHDKTFKAMIPNPDNPREGTGYIFMTLAHPKKKLDGGYDQYRGVRVNILQTYCFGILNKNQHLKRVIGIATEPPPQSKSQPGSSEDMILIEQPDEWTKQMLEDLEADCKTFNVLNDNTTNMSHYGVDEYPDENS